jgi:hypothetical protein
MILTTEEIFNFSEEWISGFPAEDRVLALREEAIEISMTDSSDIEERITYPSILRYRWTKTQDEVYTRVFEVVTTDGRLLTFASTEVFNAHLCAVFVRSYVRLMACRL